MPCRVPVLGEHNKVEIIHHGVDLRHDLVTASHRQCAARAEIILRVDHDQGFHIRPPIHADICHSMLCGAGR